MQDLARAALDVARIVKDELVADRGPFDLAPTIEVWRDGRMVCTAKPDDTRDTRSEIARSLAVVPGAFAADCVVVVAEAVVTSESGGSMGLVAHAISADDEAVLVRRYEYADVCAVDLGTPAGHTRPWVSWHALQVLDLDARPGAAALVRESMRARDGVAHVHDDLDTARFLAAAVGGQYVVGSEVVA